MAETIALIVSYSLLVFLAVYVLVLKFFWKKYFFISDGRLLFVTGLMFSRSVAEYGITSVLAWYFTYYGDHLVISSILSNIQSSLSSLMVIFIAHTADSYFGRVPTLLFSNTAYIGGMVILWLFNPYDVKWLVVISLVLLSLGTSGANTLQHVLEGLVHDLDKSHDRTKKRSFDRAEVLSRVAYVSGAFAATMWVATDATGGIQQSWRSSFLICIITMQVGSIMFCAGCKNYRKVKLRERPSQIFFRVFAHFIKKIFQYKSRRSIKLSRQNSSSKNLETKKIVKERIPEEDDMKVIKSLSRMLPIWGMYFLVSIISASGATFFLLQYSNLYMSNKIPIQINNLVQDFSSFATPLLYSKIKYFRENEKTKKEKVKIGVGILCGIISCIFAWRLEVHRLNKVSYLVDKDLNTSISFLWLVPQFFVLGCMEGLTREGVLKIYKLQMKKQRQLKSYGEEYIEIVMGLGYLMNIILLIVFKSLKGWFGDTINDSRLDKFYLFLVCVCSANFILFCCIAIFYYNEQELANNDEEQDTEDSADDQEQDTQEGMANDDHGQDSDKVSADDDHKQDN